MHIRLALHARNGPSRTHTPTYSAFHVRLLGLPSRVYEYALARTLGTLVESKAGRREALCRRIGLLQGALGQRTRHTGVHGFGFECAHVRVWPARHKRGRGERGNKEERGLSRRSTGRRSQSRRRAPVHDGGGERPRSYPPRSPDIPTSPGAGGACEAQSYPGRAGRGE